MTIPKRPSHPPGTGSNPPQGSVRPPNVTNSSVKPPSNVRDALTEAAAFAGGGALGRVSSAPQAVSASGKKTILVVDDDATMRQRLKEGLAPFYDVVEAKDGMEAVELIGTMHPPSMVVTDVMMPRLDGFMLAKILRGNPVMKKVPIMFVSSRNSTQDVTQALVLGACQYVVKTTPVSEIVAKIRKIVV